MDRNVQAMTPTDLLEEFRRLERAIALEGPSANVARRDQVEEEILRRMAW